MKIDFDKVIIFLLAISTVISVLDWIGLLPEVVSNWLNRNRLSSFIKILKELGIDVEKQKRINISHKYTDYFNQNSQKKDNISQSLEKTLQEITLSLNVEVDIGSSSIVSTNKYINVMGASTSPQKAVELSKYLTSYMKQITELDELSTVDYDFVVTPKEGSPILGYEFSRIVNKPFALHTSRPKFCGSDSEHVKFDFYKAPRKQSVALIVDDSTTGGRLVCDTIDDLRKLGYVVTDCLVLFEPQLKNVSDILHQKNVKLHSILKTHKNDKR